MNPLFLQFDYSISTPLYIQLYQHLRDEITRGAMATGVKLPSLRRFSKSLGVSITTVESAYSQLLVEGYVTSKPQSGYYVAQVSGAMPLPENATRNEMSFEEYTFEASPYRHDLSCFDFGKWKKCNTKILSDYSHLLLFESDSQGEAALRFEISKYVYKSRGVMASPDQIVIGAGIQQLTGHLCRIMRRLDIDHVATEDPGYMPVQNIFRDHGFSMTKVPVEADGIRTDKLPTNIRSAVYVSPSNQFPTGSIMPIGKRYCLLEWAKDNNSFILEDDYDSELRYFGKPIPALQGLDKDARVVYLGSFSSTLFPAIKISYMVLPMEMTPIFHAIKSDYTQTCSKTEQLTLALFMEEGHYYTNIRRLRNLYAQKLQTALAALEKYGAGIAAPANKINSGINIILKVRTKKAPEVLCEEARMLGLNVLPLAWLTDQNTAALIFYYNQIPLEEIDGLVKQLLERWTT